MAASRLSNRLCPQELISCFSCPLRDGGSALFVLRGEDCVLPHGEVGSVPSS